MMLGIGAIFGIISQRPMSRETIIAALKTLQQYGRDGYGIIFYGEGGPKVLKSMNLDDIISGLNDHVGTPLLVSCRYAIYGRPAIPNTPPFFDCGQELISTGRGASPEHPKIREELISKGHIFSGKDLSETIVHEIEEGLRRGLTVEESLLSAYSRFGGTYSCIVVDPSRRSMFLICRGLLEYVGVSENNIVVASEYEAMDGLATKIYAVRDGIFSLSLGIRGIRSIGESANVEEIRWPKKSRILGGFRYYMEREILEIPGVLRLQASAQLEEFFILATNLIAQAGRIYIVGSGSSFNAALYGAYIMNELSDVFPIVQNATEFVYFMLNKVKAGDVLIANSQSGKTADVLRAVTKSRMRGALIVGILNMLGTPLMYASNVYLPIAAGVENAVPATKTFVAQLTTFVRLASYLCTDDRIGRTLRDSLKRLPEMASVVLNEYRGKARLFAEMLRGTDNIFVLGRGLSFPIALEAALKFKEVAHIHAEGMDAGEFRHGSKTLLDLGYPVIVIVPQNIEAREDTYSLVSEIGGRSTIIIITSEDDPYAGRFTRHVIRVPRALEYLSPILYILPLQLIALELGHVRGSPVDSPPMLQKYVLSSKLSGGHQG